MDHSTLSIKRSISAGSRTCLLALALVFLVLALTGCNITKSIDDVIGEIENVKQTIAGESTAWRDQLPKLVNDLNGLESQVNADTKGIVADATNQVQDLANQTIQLSDAKAQDLIAQAGVEFRCNAQFVKAGAVAQLQYLIDDLKFWKLNKRHLDKKPIHAVCWINPTALSLYPSGSGWSIDTSNMSEKGIVHLFGYNYWAEALPTLELQNAGGQKVRNVNLTAAYVTHYQVNLDFSGETFSGVQTGYRVVLRWPDESDPNTINLTLHPAAKIKIMSAVFSPNPRTAKKDSVILRATIANQGGQRSGNFQVIWKPDPNDSRVIPASVAPLNPGESTVVSLASYVYQRGGTIPSSVSLSNGDDAQIYQVPVIEPPTPTPIPPSKKFKIDVTTGDVSYAGTDANVYITLYGDLSNSGENKLDAPGRNDFERGHTDTFNVITQQNLGNITQIRIRHDNSGLASGWFLERIVITNIDTGKSWRFVAHRWLATDEGDHAIDIFLRPN